MRHTFPFHSLSARPSHAFFLAAAHASFLSFYPTCFYSLFSTHLCFLFMLCHNFFFYSVSTCCLLPSHFISSLHSSQDLTHAHAPPSPPPTITVIIHRHQLTLLRYCLEGHASTDRPGQHLINKKNKLLSTMSAGNPSYPIPLI